MQPRSWDGLGVLVFIVIGNKSEIYIDGCVWSIGRVLGNGNIAGQCNIRNNVKFRLVTVLSRPGR